MKKILFASLALITVGCAQEGRERNYIGAAKPYCLPDNSVVWVQYSNLEGSFDGARSSLKECPWYEFEDDIR